MLLLSVPVLILALISSLYFVASFAVVVQLLADGSMRDEIHAVIGYAAAAVEGIAVAGWLRALYVSARVGSPVNHSVQIMYCVTAAIQIATAGAVAGLMGDWSEPIPFFLLHAALAASLAVLIGRSQRQATAN